MKLRMRSNSLRLRLTRSEVDRLAEQGSIVETVTFPGNTQLTYALKCNADEDGIRAAFENGAITIFVPPREAADWARTERVGISGDAGPLAVLIEKDFQCMHGEKDPDAFEALPA